VYSKTGQSDFSQAGEVSIKEERKNLHKVSDNDKHTRKTNGSSLSEHRQLNDI
jgi:hypothetical protein